MTDRFEVPSFANLDARRWSVGEQIDPAKHLELLQLAGLASSPREDFAKLISDFQSDRPTDASVEELVQAGLIEDRTAAEGYHRLPVRKPSEVKKLSVHLGAGAKGRSPNFKIDSSGKIIELRSPDQKLDPNDDEIVVELDDSSIRDASEAQKAKIRMLISYLRSRYQEAGQEPVIPRELYAALYDEPRLPSPVVRHRSAGYNGHVLAAIPDSIPAAPTTGYLPSQSFGRTVSSDSAEYQSCQQMPEGSFSRDVNQFKGFIDRVLSVVSGNEGGFESINWNDSGEGVSVGKAQWNQKVGELPALLRRWYQADAQLFNKIFGNHSHDMLRESFVRNAVITQGSELGNALEQALQEPEFKAVQTQMLREKVLTAIKLAARYGHGSELFVAEVADIGNQMGWGGVESAMRRANVAGIVDERQAIQAFKAVTEPLRAGGVSRDRSLARLFSADRRANA